MAWLAFTDPRLQTVLRRQDGVVARRQLRELGATDGDLARMIRRRDLARAWDGVYVAHTGPLSPRQRQWVAVLAAWPAALIGESALPGLESNRVQVGIVHGRVVQVPPWAVTVRTAHLCERVRWQSSPPAQRIEHAVIDVMARHLRRSDVAAAYDTLTRVLYTRRTTLARLRETLADRDRVSGRATIVSLLADLETGACSVLERGYLRRVERPHGLPRGRRQRTSLDTGRRTDQDVRYDDYRLIVELDGRAFHEGANARDRDATRDLAALATSRAATARVTYGLVFGEACRTAAWIAAILRDRGWAGVLQRCPRCS